MHLHVPDVAVARLREAFLAVEGTCEAWTDEEIVRRTLIRGAMDYAKSAGADWDARAALAADLRAQLA